MAKPANRRSVKTTTPAKSAVAAAVGKAMEKPAVGSNVVPIIGGGKAAGYALATDHAKAALADSVSWREKFMAILPLRGDALAGYKSGMNEQKAKLAQESKDSGLMVSRYVGVHMSECLTVAKAAGKGCTPDEVIKLVNAKAVGKAKTTETVAHAAIVTACREWNITHNQDGSKVEAAVEQARRGKKPMNAIEKAKRLVLRTVSFKDLPQFAVMAAALAKRIKTQDQVEAELEAKAVDVTKKNDRRKAARPATQAAA